jgi:molybdate transport system substrate-binding protein
MLLAAITYYPLYAWLGSATQPGNINYPIAIFIFPSSGTGAWEAALSNTLSRSDKVLVPRFGQFSHLWIEAFDLAISITPVIDALIKERKIVAGTRADVAYSGVGVGVRAGAPKPDVSSVEAFKRALLNVNSVAFAADGASGTYFRNLVERLGISDQMKTKLKPLSFDALIKAVPSGEAEMVVVTTSIIVAGAAELVGPVPTELQFYNSFAGGVGTDAKQADTAKEFIKFVTGPAAVALFKANGIEPGVPRP